MRASTSSYVQIPEKVPFKSHAEGVKHVSTAYGEFGGLDVARQVGRLGSTCGWHPLVIGRLEVVDGGLGVGPTRVEQLVPPKHARARRMRCEAAAQQLVLILQRSGLIHEHADVLLDILHTPRQRSGLRRLRRPRLELLLLVLIGLPLPISVIQLQIGFARCASACGKLERLHSIREGLVFYERLGESALQLAVWSQLYRLLCRLRRLRRVHLHGWRRPPLYLAAAAGLRMQQRRRGHPGRASPSAAT